MEVLVFQREHLGGKCGNTGHLHGAGEWQVLSRAYGSNMKVGCGPPSAEVGTMEALALSFDSQATSPGAAPGSIGSHKNGHHIRQP